MAAFEAISMISVRPHNRLSFIDCRTARLPEERPPMDDFDPREHRAPKSPIKLWMAYFNLLRTVFGSGVLGLPLAISQAGIVLGPVLAIATGLLIIHTHLMQIVATFMVLSQLGICTVFVDFTSDSLRDIMDWETSTPALLTLLLPYLLLEFFMKSLKVVSYVSMFGNFLNLVGLVLIFYHIFSDPHGELAFANWDPLPLLFAFGTFLFNLSAVGVVISLDKALVDPKILTSRYGVITIGIFVPTVIATIFGSLGFWSFGTMEENILRSLPFDDDTSMATMGLYLIAIALTFPIQCYPGVQIIIEVINNHNFSRAPSDRALQITEAIARPAFVIMSFLICYFIPFQGPFVAFVGNLCTTLLALVFPAMMELSLMYPGPYGEYNFYLIKNTLIIILGLVSWGFGIVLCGYLIYVRILSMNSPNN